MLAVSVFLLVVPFFAAGFALVGLLAGLLALGSDFFSEAFLAAGFWAVFFTAGLVADELAFVSPAFAGLRFRAAGLAVVFFAAGALCFGAALGGGDTSLGCALGAAAGATSAFSETDLDKVIFWMSTCV